MVTFPDPSQTHSSRWYPVVIVPAVAQSTWSGELPTVTYISPCTLKYDPPTIMKGVPPGPSKSNQPGPIDVSIYVTKNPVKAPADWLKALFLNWSEPLPGLRIDGFPPTSFAAQVQAGLVESVISC